MIQKQLDIIAIDDPSEAVAARASLERWSVKTNLHFIGKSQDLIDLFHNNYSLSKSVLLMCHGTEAGISLPEPANEVEKNQPYKKVLTSNNLKEFLHFKGNIIVNTGCLTGRKGFADAFLEKGARYYIAPQGYPSGNASLLYTLNFYYFFHVHQLPIEQAHLTAKNLDQDTKLFEIYKK